MIEAVERAMRDGQNGYAPSVGILAAREAVAADCVQRGMPMSPDRVVITSGTSEGIELALTALAGPGDDVLVPVPTYPLYTAVLAKIGARAVFYRTDPAQGWLPDVDHIRSLMSPATRALVVIDPNNPTGATYSHEVRRALVDLAETRNVPLLADEVYADLAFDGPVDGARAPQSGRAGDHVLVAVEGVSRAWLARGMDGGCRRRIGSTTCSRGSRSWRTAGCAARDRWSTGSSPRSRVTGRTRPAFRAALRERAEITHTRLNAIDGIIGRAADSGVLRDAQGRAARRRDRRGLRARAAARDGRPLRLRIRVRDDSPSDGFFRVVFLASPAELARHLLAHRRLHTGLPRRTTARSDAAPSSTRAVYSREGRGAATSDASGTTPG